jgi:chemotaxis protein methyltransferase CheR
MKSGLLHIADLLLSKTGIDITRFDADFLDKSLRKRIEATNCVAIKEYSALLEANKEEANCFINSLLVGYSEFFRNPLTFSVLESIILPSIIMKKAAAKQREVRIWSTACAAGQEAYSLAILLEEHKAGNSENIAYRIFATDKSGPQLNQAREGKYPAQALNNITLKRLGHWFSKHGNIYTINDELKKHIDFSEFDLFNEKLGCPSASIFGGFDIVMCANLLFYYKPEFQKKILRKIKNCIALGGYLVTGETERDILLKNNYYEVFPQSAIFGDAI